MGLLADIPPARVVGLHHIANTWYAAIFPPAQGRRLSWAENTVCYQLVFDMLVECPALFDGLNLIQCDVNSWCHLW